MVTLGRGSPGLSREGFKFYSWDPSSEKSRGSQFRILTSGCGIHFGYLTAAGRGSSVRTLNPPKSSSRGGEHFRGLGVHTEAATSPAKQAMSLQTHKIAELTTSQDTHWALHGPSVCPPALESSRTSRPPSSLPVGPALHWLPLPEADSPSRARIPPDTAGRAVTQRLPSD